MKILWIGVDTTSGNSGVEIVDRNLIAALRSLGATVETVSPQRVSALAQLGNTVAGWPHYRASYASAANERRLRDIALAHDVAVCSWEPFDHLAARLPIPTVPLLHNITSQSLAASNPGNPLAALLAARAGTWEHRLYKNARPFETIAVLSRADERRLRAYRSARTLYVPPGMPVIAPLPSDAGFTAELVISGTYGWKAKRRDAIVFAREYAALAHSAPVRADDLPDAARRLLAPLPLPSRWDAVRIGLIADRFVAGFKLKSTHYIASNCIVLSYADIRPEFDDIPDSAFFIRHIGHAREIGHHLDNIARVPPRELATRMNAFKAACSRVFCWRRSAETLFSALRDLRAARG